MTIHTRLWKWLSWIVKLATVILTSTATLAVAQVAFPATTPIGGFLLGSAALVVVEATFLAGWFLMEDTNQTMNERVLGAVLAYVMFVVLVMIGFAHGEQFGVVWSFRLASFMMLTASFYLTFQADINQRVADLRSRLSKEEGGSELSLHEVRLAQKTERLAIKQKHRTRRKVQRAWEAMKRRQIDEVMQREAEGLGDQVAAVLHEIVELDIPKATSSLHELGVSQEAARTYQLVQVDGGRWEATSPNTEKVFVRESPASAIASAKGSHSKSNGTH